MLGLPPERIRVELGDTNFPQAAGSGGSYGAASSGSALFDACKLRAKLAELAGVDADAARFGNGRIEAAGQSRPLTDLIGPEGVDADGEIRPGATSTEFSQQSYGAHFAEVGVEIDTGEVRLRRMLGVFTAGRILNEKTARSQAIVGMIFGLGAALEEAVDSRSSLRLLVNHDLAEYHVPVHADVLNVDAIFPSRTRRQIQSPEEPGIGELGICGAGASIANAIYNACGVRVRDYPITLDKLISELPTQA